MEEPIVNVTNPPNKLVKVDQHGTVHELYSEYFVDMFGTPHREIIPIDHPDGSIINSKLVDNSITERNIMDNNISTNKIQSGAITEIKIATNAVSNRTIRDDAITESKLVDDSVTQTKIADNSVSNSKITNNAITEVKIAAGSVTETRIANSAITEFKIANEAITSRVIRENAIIENKIANDAITTDKIKDKNVTSAKLADDLVFSGNNVFEFSPLINNIGNQTIDNFENLPGNALISVSLMREIIISLTSRITDLENKLRGGKIYQFNALTWGQFDPNLNNDENVNDENTMYATPNYIKGMLDWIKKGTPPNNQLGLAFDSDNAGTNGQFQNLGQKIITTSTISIGEPELPAFTNVAKIWVE